MSHGYPPPGYPSPPLGYGHHGEAPPAYPYGHYPGPPHPGYPPPGYPPPGYPPPGYPPPGYPYGAPPAYPYGYPPLYVAPPLPWYPNHRGRSRSRSARRDGVSKYSCRFFIGIDNDDEFRVVRRIIGANGAKMKDIVAKAGGDAKLRLRGKGSGFVERDTKAESSEPLQLCISCPRPEGYGVAIRCAEALLREVYGEYDRWCADRGLEQRAPRIKMTERHHQGDAGLAVPEQLAPKRRRKRPSSKTPAVDHGEQPEGAPDSDEIETLIEERNEARRRGDYTEADRVRDDLKDKGVVLSDEKGRHGSGLSVTSWRYWRE